MSSIQSAHMKAFYLFDIAEAGSLGGLPWRGQFLELTIVLILILELALFFLGIMR